ncbi:Multifunctional CCA protein [Candidatus Magnetaquicoccaceae bacterium FCR-1]|uniref:Multifunctional CCA protein n=1 Tax=Candidatus Magnetaquiglobus chichijimensis TaxID=3141448 RepID=A0ABQ0C6Z5_9PROT
MDNSGASAYQGDPALGLTRYRVGGCVRDGLLGVPCKERDWVVVGATPEMMRARGFRQVGQSFPVFLHPLSGEEHALARTERKAGRGHTGFAVDFAPEITLEVDLARRDLTINAMALDDANRLIDPHGGLADLKARRLRHVSAAFGEDPLRVLRVARFRATLDRFGFGIEPDTLAVMSDLVASGELHALSAERVWRETEKALSSDAPVAYFQVLDASGALAELFPELAALKGKRHSPVHHPEGDAFEHTLWVLERATRLTSDATIRFAALCHDLGKGLTPEAELPRHIAHEKRGVTVVEGLRTRLRIPKAFGSLARLVAGEHMRCHRVAEMRPGKVVDLLERLDALRRPEQLDKVLLACAADSRESPTLVHHPAGELLRAASRACQEIDAGVLAANGKQGKQLGEALRQERIRAVKRILIQARHEQSTHGA